MTPQQAYIYLTEYGGQIAVPSMYKNMPLLMLRALADECDKPSQEQQLDAAIMMTSRRKREEQARKLAEEAADAAAAPPKLPQTALDKALLNPTRLSTPSRQRAAFLRQLARCTSVDEAAARAGVNRGSVYRWRAESPGFALRWAAAVQRQAEEVNDNVVLRAAQPEVRHVYYAGKRIGEHQRANDRLQLRIQARLDAERRRAEDRAERLALAEVKARPAIDPESFAAEVAAHLRSQSATPAPASAVAASPSDSKELTDPARRSA